MTKVCDMRVNTLPAPDIRKAQRVLKILDNILDKTPQIPGASSAFFTQTGKALAKNSQFLKEAESYTQANTEKPAQNINQPQAGIEKNPIIQNNALNLLRIYLEKNKENYQNRKTIPSAAKTNNAMPHTILQNNFSARLLHGRDFGKTAGDALQPWVHTAAQTNAKISAYSTDFAAESANEYYRAKNLNSKENPSSNIAPKSHFTTMPQKESALLSIDNKLDKMIGLLISSAAQIEENSRLFRLLNKVGTLPPGTNNKSQNI